MFIDRDYERIEGKTVKNANISIVGINEVQRFKAQQNVNKIDLPYIGNDNSKTIQSIRENAKFLI